ncbi:MAG: sphingomyelin synthase family protein [Parachlamydiales bacterium]|nr:sphingomyelin synthase family protein [Parachlamydiales bacterium]
MTIPSTDSSYPQKPAWPILFLIIAAGILFSLWTEKWIGEVVPPTCNISDALQHLLTPLNAYVASHQQVGDILIIVYSIFGDAIVLVLIGAAIVRSSVRPVLPLLVFMVLRQTMQMLISFPVDPNLIWHDPGFYSLFLNYHISGDFYFSAYVGINILGALEMHEIFRKRWLTTSIFLIAFFIILIDMILRAHYSTDVYTSIITSIFVYLFIQPFIHPVDHFLKQLDKLSHLLFIFLICLAVAAIFATQYYVGLKEIPTCGIKDVIQELLSPINRFFLAHPKGADGMLILMSGLLDCMFLFMLIDTIMTRNIRPFLTFALFFALRQTMQLIVALPLPPHVIWHYPGFPSLTQDYNIANDLYFSGHAGISLIAALELSSFGKRWLTILGFSIFGFESFMVIAMQIHYTMDVFTAIMTVFCITDLSCHLAHPINRFLTKITRRLS